MCVSVLGKEEGVVTLIFIIRDTGAVVCHNDL